MIKKLVVIFIILVIVICCLVSCDSSNGITLTGYSFIDGIVDGDYGRSYENCYFSLKEQCTKEEFIQRYTNIFDALQVDKVTLISRDIPDADKDQETYEMNYTLELRSTLIGNVQYDYRATIMKDVSGYSVEFNPSLILPYMESGDTVKVETLYGSRGEIFDRNKELLAKNTYADTVYIVSGEIEDIESTAAKLETLTGQSSKDIVEDYNHAVEKGYDTVTIKAFNINELNDDTKNELLSITGVYVDNDSLTPIRYYPYQDALAHLIGYCGVVTEEDIEADSSLSAGDLLGKTGLEKEYDQVLRGKNGKKIYVRDSAGNEKYIIYDNPAVCGTDLVLSLDINEQNKAFTLLSTYLLEGQSGCAIEMDYYTGAVKAAVSYPSYDPNWFSLGIDSEKWDYLNDEANNYPLYNRISQAVYQPGSTFKVFTCVPAIEDGIIDPEQVVDLNIHDNKWKPTDDMLPEDEPWIYPEIKRSEETKGELNMINAIKSSDNIFFAYLALLTGKERFAEYMDTIGLGSAVSFDIPVTTSQFYGPNTEYTLHILATSGYGMGEIQLTPLQLASMYTCFVNDGNILNPYMVENMYCEENGEYVLKYTAEPSFFREKIMQSSTIDTLINAMRLVVTKGTAASLDLAQYDIFGKTGTATLVSSGENSREINWIILLSREKGNEKLILVMVDSKADEGDNKFKIARGLIFPDKQYYETEDSSDLIVETESESSAEEIIASDDIVDEEGETAA